MPPTGDLAGSPGMCPDWESNLQPFGLQAGTQSTEPHQPTVQFIISPTVHKDSLSFTSSPAFLSLISGNGHISYGFNSFQKFYLFLFREWRREGEKHPCVVASFMPTAGDLLTTQARALTGNPTSNPWVSRPALNPPSHTSQGS